jgi:hypothetical protein
MGRKLFLNVLVLTAAIAFPMTIFSVSSFALDLYSISIPSDVLIPHLQGGKRITGYSLNVNGIVYGVSKIPEDWTVHIMPAVEVHQVEAAAGHGLSWIAPGEVQQGIFTNFLTIMRVERYGALKIKIDFSIDIPMEEEETHLILSEKDIRIEPQH